MAKTKDGTVGRYAQKVGVSAGLIEEMMKDAQRRAWREIRRASKDPKAARRYILAGVGDPMLFRSLSKWAEHAVHEVIARCTVLADRNSAWNFHDLVLEAMRVAAQDMADMLLSSEKPALKVHMERYFDLERGSDGEA